jgi:hypothetical protein
LAQFILHLADELADVVDAHLAERRIDQTAIMRALLL